jgi:serine/threonine protein kinase
MTDRGGQSPVPVIAGYADFVRIGHGGSSRVYRATQEAFGRTVAVKILASDTLDGGAARRFQREALLMGRVSSHPNIVTVLDSGFTASGHPFLAMEFFERGTLADRVATHPLSIAEILNIGVKLAGALESAHHAGIVHKDMKPQNVLISRYGEPAIADFGIAVGVGHETTTTGGGLTVAHAPPEMLEGEPGDARSDVYSLGSTLYTLLAGRNAFAGDSLLAIMNKVLSEPPPRIDRADLPHELTALLDRMLAKDPAKRPVRALDIGLALQEVERREGRAPTPLPISDEIEPITVEPPVEPTPSQPASSETTTARPDPVSDSTVGRPVSRPLPPSPAPAPPPAPRPHRRRAFAAGAVVVLAGLGLVVAALQQDDDGGDTGATTTTARPTEVDVVGPVSPTAVSVAFGGTAGQLDAIVSWQYSGEPTGVEYHLEWQLCGGGSEACSGGGTETFTSSPGTVTDLPADGADFCFELVAVRGGLVSPEPDDPTCEALPR